MPVAIDFAEARTIKYRLIGDLTITSMTAPVEGNYNLIIEQDAIGNHVLTFPANVTSRPRWDLSASTKVLVPFYFDGTDFCALESNPRERTATWTFSNNTTAADPGAGNFRVNGAITEMYISDTTKQGVNSLNLFTILRTNDRILISEPTDATTWFAFTMTTKATNNTGWHTFAISADNQGSGSLKNNVDSDISFVEA